MGTVPGKFQLFSRILPKHIFRYLFTFLKKLMMVGWMIYALKEEIGMIKL